MIVILTLNIEKFVIHILILKIKTLVDFLNEIIILIKYFNYTNIFLLKFTAKLLKYSNSNYIIELKKGK